MYNINNFIILLQVRENASNNNGESNAYYYLLLTYKLQYIIPTLSPISGSSLDPKLEHENYVKTVV